MNISDIIDNITNTLDSAKMPANVLPPFLLKCTALNRPGLSAYKIASRIIENNRALGIPVEDNPDGTANLINQYTYNVVKCMVDAIKNDASVQVAIPQQSLLIQATGGNGGGPVTCIGSNLLDSIGNGIMQ
jgi:hypothetical protein